jgi:hypothetical protein
MISDTPGRTGAGGRWMRRLRTGGFVVAFVGGWLVGHATARPAASTHAVMQRAQTAAPNLHPSTPRWLRALRASSSPAA